MRSPLPLAAAGLVLVAVDVHPRSFDLLPDAPGWALVAVAAWLLRSRLAALAALIAAVLSTAEALLPYHVVHLDPDTGQVLAGPSTSPYAENRWDALPLGRATAVVGAAVLGVLALGLLQRTLAARQHEEGRRPRRRLLLSYLGVVAWAASGVVVLLTDALGDRRYDPVWDGIAGDVGAAGVVLVLVHAVLLLQAYDETWAWVPGHRSSSQWSSDVLRPV